MTKQEAIKILEAVLADGELSIQVMEALQTVLKAVNLVPELVEALKLLNRMGQQRYKWPRDSNEDNDGWLQITVITEQALSKIEGGE